MGTIIAQFSCKVQQMQCASKSLDCKPRSFQSMPYALLVISRLVIYVHMRTQEDDHLHNVKSKALYNDAAMEAQSA